MMIADDYNKAFAEFRNKMRELAKSDNEDIVFLINLDVRTNTVSVQPR